MRRSSDRSVAEFYLPQGFEGFPDDDYEQIVEMFFLLYRVLRRFAGDRGLRDDRRLPRREGFFAQPAQIVLTDASDEQVTISFAKLNAFECIIESFDEMILAAVISKTRTVPPNDVRRLHVDLNRALFNRDDTLFFESSVGQRMELEDGAQSLAGLFCFVYLEMVRRLDPERVVHPEVRSRSDRFSEEHLPENRDLFGFTAHAEVVPVLKDLLEKIHRTTAYKDDDYWALYEVLEFLLYRDELAEGDTGTPIWGVTDFYPVWEEMGHSVIREIYRNEPNGRIVYSDCARLKSLASSPNEFGEEYPFFFDFGGTRRRMYPDAVLVRDAESVRRRSHFDEMFRIRTMRGQRGLAIEIRPQNDAGSSWIDGLKKEMQKRGWTSHPTTGGVLFRNVPEKIFQSALDKLYQTFKRQARSEDVWYIVDFKYINPALLAHRSPGATVSQGVRKQLVYEIALADFLSKKRGPFAIRNQLVFPAFLSGDDRAIVDLAADPHHLFGGKRLSDELVQSGLTFLGLNFQKAAATYVREKL